MAGTSSSSKLVARIESRQLTQMVVLDIGDLAQGIYLYRTQITRHGKQERLPFKKLAILK